MVKLKTILDTRRAKSDGSFSILFRITNYKDVKYIPLGISVHENHWDDKTCSLNKNHPNANALNTLISKRFYEIQKAIVTLDDQQGYTFKALKDMLSPEPLKVVKTVTFKEYAQTVIDDMIKVKRTGNALVYLTAVNRLISYCGNPNITFKEIDYTFLDKFKNQLTHEGLKKNSVGNYFRSIRALYNKAIKAKIVSRDLYPFHDISIKTEKTAKRAITIGELKRIYNHPNEVNSLAWHSANYFFLSYTLRGISFTDMAYLKPQNIHKGYLTYRRRKTQKLYTIKLHPTALRFIDLYKGNSTGYLLPVFPIGTNEDSIEAKKITRQWIKNTNRYLNKIANACKIENHITTYVIRHTWATTAKRLGYANEMIAEGMGHEYGNKITNTYLDDFEQHLIDAMNDNVIISVIPCIRQVMFPYKFVLRASVIKGPIMLV